MSKLYLSAQLAKIESKVDRTLKLIFYTQELGEDAGKLMNISGEQVNMVIVSGEEDLKPDDIPDVPTGEEYGNRTPSQLQRAILYRIWEARGKTNTFESYYRQRMSKNEQLLKAELDKLTT